MLLNSSSITFAHVFQLRVNTVHEKGTARYTQQDSLDESGGMFPRCVLTFAESESLIGGNLNAASRQALMQKLARIEPPPTAAKIYQWLRTREGPKPVARCFGACARKLVFPGLRRDNGRREPSIILGCGHVVGGHCFSHLVDLARAEGEDAVCPHCLQVPIIAAV